MAKRRHSKKSKSKPKRIVVKDRRPSKAAIQALIKAQPQWWKMKVRDWMPLVLELCSRKEKLTRYDPTYRAAHDLIDNERRRQKKRDDCAIQ